MTNTFTFDPAIAAKATKRAMNAVESKNTIPVLGCVRIRVAGDKAVIEATDLDKTIYVTFPILEATGAIPVMVTAAKRFLRICESADKGATMTATEIDAPKVIEHIDQGQIKRRTEYGSIEFASGSFSANVDSHPADDWPEFVKTVDGVENTATVSEFRDWLIAARFAVSTEETRYYLNGVFFTTHRGYLELVATDGHRLANVKPSGTFTAISDNGAIVPRLTVDAILKVFNKPSEERLTFEISEARIVVSTDDITIKSKLIDGAFPDYPRIFPRDTSLGALASTKTLAAQSDKLIKLSGDKDATGAIDFATGDVTVTHDGTFRVPAFTPAPGVSEVTIGLNLRYMSEMSKAFAKSGLDDQMEVHSSDCPNSPILVKAGRAGMSLDVVQMPVRT